jgi:hypothetical protein
LLEQCFEEFLTREEVGTPERPRVSQVNHATARGTPAIIDEDERGRR